MPKPDRKIDPSRGGSWGIVGGTFNPIHFGHLIMADAVMHSVGAEGMVFVPARQHPFKSNRGLNNYDDRVAMIRLALGSNSRFCMVDPPASEYTIDLIDYLRHKYAPADFFLVVGSDIIDEFDSWYKHEEIEHSIRIVIAARPGYKQKPGARTLKTAERVMIPQFDISSSDIRERVRSRLTIRYMLPEAVEKYIFEKNLYVEK